MNIDIKSGDRDPEEEAIRAQKIKLMHEVVKKLKPRYRELIELRYFKELSYEEISQELDIPLGTVKAQLFRAKEIMYNHLQNPGAKAYIETTLRKKDRIKAKEEAMAAAINLN